MKKTIKLLLAIMATGFMANAQKIIIIQDEHGKYHPARTLFVRDSSSGIFFTSVGMLVVYKDRENGQLYYRKIDSTGHVTRKYLTKIDSIYIK